MWSTVTRSGSSVTIYVSAHSHGRSRGPARAGADPSLLAGAAQGPRWPTRSCDHQCLARPQGAGTSALASISTSVSGGRSRPSTRSTVTAAASSRQRIWIPRAGGGDIQEAEGFVGAAAPARVLGGQERRLLRRPKGTACAHGSGQPPDRECTATSCRSRAPLGGRAVLPNLSESFGRCALLPLAGPAPQPPAGRNDRLEAHGDSACRASSSGGRSPEGHFSIPREGEVVTTWFSSGRGVVVGGPRTRQCAPPRARATGSVGRQAPVPCHPRKVATWTKAPCFQCSAVTPAML